MFVNDLDSTKMSNANIHRCYSDKCHSVTEGGHPCKQEMNSTRNRTVRKCCATNTYIPRKLF